MSQQIWATPTLDLRFVRRIVGPEIRSILQQRWDCRRDTDAGTVKRWSEWRDVPTEEPGA